MYRKQRDSAFNKASSKKKKKNPLRFIITQFQVAADKATPRATFRKIYLSQDSTPKVEPDQKRGPYVLILVPKDSSPLLICLFTLPCFHVQLRRALDLGAE